MDITMRFIARLRHVLDVNKTQYMWNGQPFLRQRKAAILTKYTREFIRFDERGWPKEPLANNELSTVIWVLVPVEVVPDD